MERLTYDDGDLAVCYGCDRKGICHSLWCVQQLRVIAKLVEYEKTGLTPEQVWELAEKKQSRREWYQKGYADGKKDAENDRWIPVEERLPEEVDERQDILILLSSGRMVVANYVKTANKGKIFFDGYDMFHPVAWQPLPDPYCTVNKTEMPDWK